MNNTPLVLIKCFVYNHEQYLRQCLDGSAAIIREYAEKYPNIIKPIYELENQYSKKDGSLGLVINNIKLGINPKYITTSEGDDYWMDPNKLQMQVDILESHPFWFDFDGL